MNNQVGYRMNSLPSMQEMHQLVEVSKVLASAPFYQKLGPGGVLAIYLTAREMNLPVMLCLNGGLHNIEGKVVFSAQLMNMMLVNAGWEIKFLQMDNEGCELKFIYPSKNREETFKFTIEDAKKAGYLGVAGPNGTWAKKPKDNWLYHPLDMCFSRAMASGARKYAPNVIGNCYGVGELDNDDHIKPLIPDNIQKDTEISEKEQQKLDESLLINFKERNSIIKDSDIYKYIEHIAKSRKINFQECLEICYRNEESFLQSFKQREEKQKRLTQETIQEQANEEDAKSDV